MKHVLKSVILLTSIVAYTLFGTNTAKAQTVNTSVNVLTTEGLGDVKLGMVAKELPESIPGLYSRKTDKQNEIYFYDENGTELFLVIPDENGLISYVNVTSPVITTAEGAHVGMNKEEVESLAGAFYIEPDPYADFPRDSYELFGITLLMDFEGQGIVTEMSVTNVPDDFDIAIEKQQKVHKGVSKYLHLSRTFRDFLRFLNDILQMEFVKSAYAVGNNVIVDVEDFGKVFYSFSPDDNSLSISNMRELKAELQRIVSPGASKYKFDDIVVAFQMAKDDKFAEEKKLLEDNIKLMFNGSGYKNVSFEKPTVRFFLHDMYNHNFVFLDTHGDYDGKLHWLATSERIINMKEELRKYKQCIKNELVTLHFLCNETHDGMKANIPYVGISENLIYMARNKFAYKAPVIIYNTACQSMKGSHSLAEAFRSKGAYLYLGYNNDENVGVSGGLQFFGRLLSGMTVEGALKSLDSEVVYNAPNNARLEFSPKAGTSQYNNIKDYFYVRPELVDEHVFSYSKAPVKYHWKSDTGEEVQGEDYLINIHYSATAPLHWIDYPHFQYNKCYTKKFSEIPLKYGIQLCPDENFKEGTFTIISVPINSPYTLADIETGEKYVDAKAEYKDGMVLFVVDLKLPATNFLRNNTTGLCYIRPVVYDTITQKYVSGNGIYHHLKNPHHP